MVAALLAGELVVALELDQGVEGVDSEFYWIKQVADDRPDYILTHRMLQRQPDHLAMLSRDFYVGHSFNAAQAAAGALPVEGGVVIFYGNRTSSDQVAGFMSGMRHEIGRGMMRDSLVEAMEEEQAISKSTPSCQLPPPA